MRLDDHRACEMRYRDLLGRLHDVTERLERVEEDQRTMLDILRDFRELMRLVMSRLRALRSRVDQCRPSHPRYPGAREGIARHLRN